MDINTESINRLSITENVPENSSAPTGIQSTSGDCPGEQQSSQLPVNNTTFSPVSVQVPSTNANISVIRSEDIETSIGATEESNSEPSHEERPCSYLWQYLDNDGFWITYGRRDNGVSHTSDEIETYYQNGQNCYYINTKYNNFELDFEIMIQKNLTSYHIRPIRRKVVPEFEDWNSLPFYWDDMGSKEAVGPSMIISLSKNSREYLHYQNVVYHFLPRAVIKELYRIQAPHLYRSYQSRKALLKEKNPSVEYLEEYFYHGTDRDNVNIISQENFDWRRHGSVNGQQDGCGAYFTNRLDTAANYGLLKRRLPSGSLRRDTRINCPAQKKAASLMSPRALSWTTSRPEDLSRPLMIDDVLNKDRSVGEYGITVMVAKVLTGYKRVGHGRDLLPGACRNGIPYDTTVNSDTPHSEYVKYNMEEYYPEYCIVMDNY